MALASHSTIRVGTIALGHFEEIHAVDYIAFGNGIARERCVAQRSLDLSRVNLPPVETSKQEALSGRGITGKLLQECVESDGDGLACGVRTTGLIKQPEWHAHCDEDHSGQSGCYRRTWLKF